MTARIRLGRSKPGRQPAQKTHPPPPSPLKQAHARHFCGVSLNSSAFAAIPRKPTTRASRPLNHSSLGSLVRHFPHKANASVPQSASLPIDGGWGGGGGRREPKQAPKVSIDWAPCPPSLPPAPMVWSRIAGLLVFRHGFP